MSEEHDQKNPKFRHEEACQNCGMIVKSTTLRDYFAITIAAGKLNEWGDEELAERAYKFADIMLKEREKF